MIVFRGKWQNGNKGVHSLLRCAQEQQQWAQQP